MKRRRGHNSIEVGSDQSWDAYLQSWVENEQLHGASALIGLLDQGFDRQYVSRGPYFVPDLAETSEEDELAAIEAGEIRASRLDYVGKPR